jgi:uncharacterized protein YjbI with pentapeptide repeats
MVEKKGGQTADKKKGRKPWTLKEFGGQTVWDWLHLLSALAIPVVLAAAGLWFTAQQDQRQVAIEEQRAEAERELAEQRAQDEALQAYLDQMSQLMLERKLLEAEPGDPVHTLAQARTATVILRLDAEHNESVTHFLINSGLAVRSEASPRLLSGIPLSRATLSNAHLVDADLLHADMSGADMSGAYLFFARLRGATLAGTNLKGAFLSGADLRRAFLRGANLSDAGLSSANLSDANLRGANLRGANLSGVTDLPDANLRDANLRDANLRDANLSFADLIGVDLSDANLSAADLSAADLTGAEGITNEELEQQARSLEGATMPNGQKYEDWIKSKDRKGEG